MGTSMRTRRYKANRHFKGKKIEFDSIDTDPADYDSDELQKIEILFEENEKNEEDKEEDETEPLKKKTKVNSKSCNSN